MSDRDFLNKLDEIEQLADKANSGPWIYNNNRIDSTDHEAFSYIAENINEQNGKYIAAVNPKIIKEIIQEIKYKYKINIYSWDYKEEENKIKSNNKYNILLYIFASIGIINLIAMGNNDNLLFPKIIAGICLIGMIFSFLKGRCF